MDPAARKRLVLLIAFLIVGSALGVVRLIVDMQINGTVNYTWVIGFIVFDAIVLIALAFYTRTREEQVGDLEQRLAARTREQGSSRGGWLLAVFDNGLVMQAQRGGFLVSFYLCYAPDLQRYAPTLAEIQAYMRGTGVMRRVQGVSKSKGDPGAQALLEQIRQRLGARWALMQLAKRRPTKRPDVRAPAWLVGVTCNWSKWYLHADDLLGSVDAVADLLDSAQKQYFAPSMTVG